MNSKDPTKVDTSANQGHKQLPTCINCPRTSKNYGKFIGGFKGHPFKYNDFVF